MPDEPSSDTPFQYSWKKCTRNELIAIPESVVERFLIPPEEDIQTKMRLSSFRSSVLPDTSVVESFLGGGVFLSGVSQLSEDYYVERSQLEFNLVIFIFSGSLQVRIDGGVRQTVSEGDVLVAPVGSSLSYEGSAECEIGWFHLLDKLPWSQVKGKGVSFGPYEQMSTVYCLMEAYLKEVSNKKPDSLPLLREFARVLLFMLKRLFDSSSDPVDPEQFQRLEKLWLQVRESMNLNWNLEQLAKSCNCSEGHLNRLCQTYYNATPSHLVKEIRLSEAASLLKNTHLTLSAIAGKVGYSNESSLSKAFKGFYNVSPKEFRAQE